jgi:hypothetical protein
LTIEIDGASLADASEIHVTLSQGRDRVVDITDAELIGDSSLSLTLTQAQTAKFSDSAPVQIQVNFIVGVLRKATSIATIPVESNLLRRMLNG